MEIWKVVNGNYIFLKLISKPCPKKNAILIKAFLPCQCLRCQVLPIVVYIFFLISKKDSLISKERGTQVHRKYTGVNKSRVEITKVK